MTEILPSAPGRRVLRHIDSELRSHWMGLLAVVILGLLTAIAGLVGPWAVGRLVDSLLVSRTLEPVLWHVAVIIAAGLATGVGTWGGTVILAKVLEPVIASLRESVLTSGLALDSRTVGYASSGDLVSRVADDSQEVSTAATTVVPMVVQAGFTVVVSAIGMGALDWRLGIIGLVAIPLYWTTLRAYLPRSGKLYREEREAFGVRTQRLLGAVEGAETLRAFGAERVELDRVDHASAIARDISIRVFRFVTWAFSRNNRAEAIVLVLILGVGFLLVDADVVTVGAVSTAALIFHRLFGPIGVLVGMFDQIQSAAASLVRMVGVIDAASNQDTGSTPVKSGSIELCNIAHSYDTGREVIHDLDLSIRPGEHVALVGTTGAGKSTVALMVAGLLRPTSGTVTVAGTDMRTLDPVSLRHSILMVSQEIHCFRGTVLDNVRIARPDASDNDALAALSQVGDQWLTRLPQGADTVIGDGGFKLTGVEKQIIALSRVQLVDPEVVILDEATAESDSDGAQRLDLAAASVLAGRTALIVAHRLSQAATAHRIVVMEHGRIVESGSHQQLLGARGPYSQLWTAWTGAYAAEG